MGGTSHTTAVAGALEVIGVLVADAQPLYRDAVVRVIRQQSAFQLTAEHADGRAALAAIRALRPEVAVVDAALPGLSGVRVVRAAVRDGLPTAVVLLAGAMRPEDAYAALGAGACGILSKSATAAELEAAIRWAARGEVYIAPGAQTGVAHQIRLRGRAAGPVLSPREHEILERMAAGLSGPAIARELRVGTETVKTHVANLYAKLDVSDRAAAVAQAMRSGLLE